MKSRREFLKTAGLTFSALLTLPIYGCKNGSNNNRPNIVLILADDMGWSDLGCYGGEIATPNLDRLAEKGIRFTQFFNTAKCFPSRACLLTGLYAQQCGMARQPAAIKNGVTLGEVLKNAGYRTLMTGKHHGTDNPYDRGFDHYYGLRDGATNHFNPGFQRANEEKPAQKRPGKRFFCFDDQVLQPYTPKEKDFYSTDYYTNWALDFLEKYKNENKPFFLYLSYQAPHDPLQAWPEDIAKYRGKYKSGFEAIAKARYERQRNMGLIDNTFPRSTPTHRDWTSLPESEKEDQDLRMAVYAAMIDRMDSNIGRVISKVEELGERQNTLIIFVSDNGCSAEVVERGYGQIGTITRWASLGKDWANVSNTPYRYFKNYSHQGGICTPMIASWPDVIKQNGSVSKYMGHFIDFMATFVDITGAQYPQTINGKRVPPYEGESFLPVLKGSKKPRKKPLFWQWQRGKGVMTDRWKLVALNNQWELFDIKKDKTETTNLAAENTEVVAELKFLYDQWFNRVNQNGE